MQLTHKQTRFIGYVPSKGFIKKINCAGSLVFTDSFHKAKQFQNLGNFNVALRYIDTYSKEYTITPIEIELELKLKEETLFAAEIGFDRAEITNKQIRKEKEDQKSI